MSNDSTTKPRQFRSASDRNLPKLRIVPLESLTLHERCDKEKVERLLRRLQEDGSLRNPIIVVEVGSKFVVLDGANRVLALRELGCRDALVQIVDYAEVELRTWCHLVSNVGRDRLLYRLREVGIELERTERKLAEATLREREIPSYITFGDGQVYAVKGGEETLAQMVDIYGAEGEIYRIEDDQIDGSLRNREDVVFAFPRHTPSEIVELATNGVKLPAGVTRHLIPRRALRVNIDLEILESGMPLGEKNALLERLIERRLAKKRVRFYPESTVVFDE